MTCEVYSNYCNVAGYYSDSVSPFSYQDSDAWNHTDTNECGVSYYSNNRGPFNWTNTSECGGSYYVNHLGCYKNVAFDNWPDYNNVPFENFTDYVNNNENLCQEHHVDYSEGHTDYCDDCYDRWFTTSKTFHTDWTNVDCWYDYFGNGYADGYQDGYQNGCIQHNDSDVHTNYTNNSWCDDYLNYTDYWPDYSNIAFTNWSDFYNIPFNNFCNHADIHNSA